MLLVYWFKHKKVPSLIMNALFEQCVICYIMLNFRAAFYDGEASKPHCNIKALPEYAY